MCYHLRTKQGNTEAVIDDNCGISKFYEIAETLTNEMQISFLNKVNSKDTLIWDFKDKRQLLKLHYNLFKCVSLFPQHVKSILQENNVVLEVANFLEHRA